MPYEAGIALKEIDHVLLIGTLAPTKDCFLSPLVYKLSCIL
jgi:hypothetical protein